MCVCDVGVRSCGGPCKPKYAFDFSRSIFFSFSEKKLKDTDSLMIPLFPPLLSLSHFPVS